MQRPQRRSPLRNQLNQKNKGDAMCGPAAPLVITTIAAAVGGAAHAKHEGGKKERKAEAAAE